MKNDFLAIGDCENVELIIKPQSEGKSNAQIRAFHGPILEQIQSFEMATNGVYKTKDRIKHDLKEAFLQKQRRYWSDGSPVIIKIQHPERKGVKEVPEINPNSIKLAENRLRRSSQNGEVLPIHQRLYS